MVAFLSAPAYSAQENDLYMSNSFALYFFLIAVTGSTALFGDDSDRRILDARMHHLRLGTEREWNTYAEQAEGDALNLDFKLDKIDTELTLMLRQRDVKQMWKVSLNDHPLGQLVQDENDLTLSFALSSAILNQSVNHLRIEPQQRGGTSSDDIEVGQVAIYYAPQQDVLHQCALDVTVLDAE